MLFHQCDLLPGEENKAVWKCGGSVSGMGWDCEIGKSSWRGIQERGERREGGYREGKRCWRRCTWSRVAGSATACLRGSSVLGSPGSPVPGTVRTQTRLLLLPGGRAAAGRGGAGAASWRLGGRCSPARVCGLQRSWTRETEEVSKLGAGAGRVCAGRRGPGAAPDGEGFGLLQVCAVLSLSVGSRIPAWPPQCRGWRCAPVSYRAPCTLDSPNRWWRTCAGL